MIGNVWEWVIGDVSGRTYGSRTLPSTGYVANADSTGIATETVADPQPSFHNDYFWSKDEGAFVMMRGGFYGSGDDAGVYSTHAGIAPGFAGAAVGFRCVKDM